MASLHDLNTGDVNSVVRLLEPLIERAPYIAAKVADKRPFLSCEDLIEAIGHELHHLDLEQKIALFQAHPELAPDNPLTMTKASQGEQGRLGLTDETSSFKQQLDTLNAQYTKTHGFPFITALVRHQNMESVLQEFKARLQETTEAETRRALIEIATVSSERVRRTFDASIPSKSPKVE
ncbi:OHCU decarboxylase [Rhodobacteraceae bacterium (ex Bugula neritina AB1)]|nr:OHCU decarboxylase [Rhodobacteraceae bacterium (ex Bugula neritina AB1)]